MWVTIVTNEGYKGVKSRLHVKANTEPEKKKGYNPNFKYYSPSNTIAKNLSYRRFFVAYILFSLYITCRLWHIYYLPSFQP
jgi:hypothetical protein